MSEIAVIELDVSDPLLNAGPCGTFPRDFTASPVGSMTFAPGADFELIPRDQWADRIRQQEADKSRLIDVMKDQGMKSYHQRNTQFCHGNSPAMAIQGLRAAQNQPFVLLSPASIAAPTTNYQNLGQFIEKDLAQIVRVGCASQAFVPPNQITRDGFQPGWEEDAAQYKVDEWWDLGYKDSTMFDRCMTLALSRIPVCVAYNWWRHAVTIFAGYMDANGQFGFILRNSWGDWPEPGADGWFILMEHGRNSATPDQAYAPRSTVLARAA